MKGNTKYCTGLNSQAIDYKKTMARYELQNINNPIAILNRDIYNKRNEVAYLRFEVQELEEYLRGPKNHIQQQPIS
ncbi:MAG TPA: hypothetical protein VE223_01100 [Nitrososphaeraceae archaeon]|nr:hypothetical protein [Nitrososphaeraceae archaeon]